MALFIAIVLLVGGAINMSYEQSKQNPNAPHFYQSESVTRNQG